MRVTDLFALLVIRHRVMSMTEFYEADAFDVDLMASNLDQAERDASERTRLIMWAALAPNSKKKIAPEEVMTFSWEKPQGETQAVTTKEQFDEMFKRFKKVE